MIKMKSQDSGRGAVFVGKKSISIFGHSWSMGILILVVGVILSCEDTKA